MCSKSPRTLTLSRCFEPVLRPFVEAVWGGERREGWVRGDRVVSAYACGLYGKSADHQIESWLLLQAKDLSAFPGFWIKSSNQLNWGYKPPNIGSRSIGGERKRQLHGYVTVLYAIKDQCSERPSKLLFLPSGHRFCTMANTQADSVTVHSLNEESAYSLTNAKGGTCIDLSGGDNVSSTSKLPYLAL